MPSWENGRPLNHHELGQFTDGFNKLLKELGIPATTPDEIVNIERHMQDTYGEEFIVHQLGGF